jgi:hypothetical protein
MHMRKLGEANWDDLIASAEFGDSSEAELGRYTLVKLFDGDEIWIYEWRDNNPVLRAEIVVHGSISAKR